MPQDKSRVIFIGNIPYGLTEEQIIEIFSKVGQVNSFRLVYDKDTGKPKGFGFAEFSDAEMAASAVRNLNDYDVMGRKLRVDYSNDGGANDAAPANYTSQISAPNNGDGTSFTTSNTLPPLPPGAELPPNITCADAISRTLGTLPPPQLLDILSQMKGLVMDQPAKAVELLKQAPQLSYAIFQSLLLLGLVDLSVLSQVVGQPQVVPPPNPPQPQIPPPVPSYLQQPNTATPPLFNQGYSMPQPPPQPPALSDRDALIQQVLAMTQQQVDALPPVERAQIMTLRAQLGAGPRY